MPKVTAAIAALVLVFVLAGCGEAETDGNADRASSTAANESTEPTPSAAPLSAETPQPLNAEEAEVAFLVEVHDRLAKIQSQIPNATDQQLVTAAQEACDRLESGESGENMSLIDGEEETNGYFMDSGAIIIAARLTMCPIE